MGKTDTEKMAAPKGCDMISGRLERYPSGELCKTVLHTCLTLPHGEGTGMCFYTLLCLSLIKGSK